MMSWIFSEEIILAVATWQWFLGIGLALCLAVIIKKYGTVKPASRYGVWACAFFTIAILPWAALLPSSKETVALPPLHETTTAQARPVATFSKEIPTFQPAISISQAGEVSITQGQTKPLKAKAEVQPQGPIPFVFDPVKEAKTTPAFSLADHGFTLLFGLWAMVAFFFLAKLLLAVKRLGVLKREANPLEGPLQTWFVNQLNLLSLKRQPKLMSHETIGSPLVAGLFRPAILIPEPLLHELSGEELQQILLHELAHVRRFDDWVHFFQKAILAVFWFHPALHWFSKQMAWDRESACDQWAISLTGKSKQYAQSLLRVSETMFQPHAGLLTVGAVRGRKQLTHRIESLLDGKNRSRKLSPLAKSSLFALFFTCIASMAIAGPKLVWFHEPPPPPAPEPISQMAHASDEEEKEREREAHARLLKEELALLRQEKARLKRELAQLGEKRDRAQRKADQKALLREQGSAKAHLARAKAQLEKHMAALSEAKQEEKAQLQEQVEESRRLVKELAQVEKQELRRYEEELFEAQKAMEKEQAMVMKDQAILEKEQAEMEKLVETMRKDIERAHELEGKAHREEFRRMERAQLRELREAQRHLERDARHMAQEHAAMSRDHHVMVEDHHRGPDYVKTDRGYAFGSTSGKSQITFTTDNFKVEIRTQVTFSEDETTVTHLSKKGYFKITDKRNPRKKHQLTVTPGKNGEPQFNYKLNRSKKPFDQKAQAWLEETLPRVLMDLGVGADLRVQRMLEAEGVEGVFNLVQDIEGDYSKESHIAAFLAQSEFTTEELNRLGDMIKGMGSDFHKARLLIKVAENQQAHSGLAHVLADAMVGMNSDFEKRRVLAHALPLAENQAMLTNLFDIAKTMNSDFEKRQVLVKASSHFQGSDLAESGYLEVLEQIQSDFEFSQGVLVLAKEGNLSQEHAQALLKLAGNHVQSDFELARVFNHLSDMVPVNDTFNQALRTIGSDHTKSQVLEMYIKKGNLSQAEQAQLLDSAMSLSSDHQMAKVLRSFRDNYALSGDVAQKFNAAVETIESDHLRRDLNDY